MSIIESLRQNGRPVTRERYIRLNYLGRPPEPWTREHEGELPEFLQDWDLDFPEFADAEDSVPHFMVRPEPEPEEKHSPDPESYRVLDPVIAHMRIESIPLTRENYLALAYPDGLPAPWTAELEAELPEELRTPLWFWDQLGDPRSDAPSLVSPDNSLASSR
jgi:hypothetical protein